MTSLCSLMNVYQPRQREVVSMLFLYVLCDETGCTQRVAEHRLLLEFHERKDLREFSGFGNFLLVWSPNF